MSDKNYIRPVCFWNGACLVIIGGGVIYGDQWLWLRSGSGMMFELGVAMLVMGIGLIICSGAPYTKRWAPRLPRVQWRHTMVPLLSGLWLMTIGILDPNIHGSFHVSEPPVFTLVFGFAATFWSSVAGALSISEEQAETDDRKPELEGKWCPLCGAPILTSNSPRAVDACPSSAQATPSSSYWRRHQSRTL